MTLGWALIMGLLQTQVLSVLAYTAVALSAYWVALLGSVLPYPQTWSALNEAMMVAILQSGFALTAVLLLNRPAAVGDPAGWRRWSLALNWLAVGLLTAVPVGVAATLGGVDALAAWQMHEVTAGTAFLAVRGLLLSVAGLAARLSIGRIALRLPALPPGDLLVPISDGLSAVFARGQHLGDRQLPLWRDAGLSRLRRLWFGAHWWRTLARMEFELNRWNTVLLVLLLLGLMLAWRGAVG